MYNLTPIDIIIEQCYDDFPMTAGLNDKILQLLKVKTENLPRDKKDVILEMDEMQLDPELKYLDRLDCVVGFEDDGEHKTQKQAEYVTTIWIHSIGGTWMMPLCFIFTSASATIEQIKPLLFKSITKVEEIGLDVLGLITRMRVNFYDLMLHLEVSPENPKFTVGSKEVIFLFEVPQLMNITRNTLEKYKLKFYEYRTSWKHIKSLFEIESETPGPQKTKLRMTHIKLSKDDRVVPRYSIETLSNSVATELRAHVNEGMLSSAAAGTAEFVEMFDKLFDLFNSIQETSETELTSSFKGTEAQCRFIDRVLAFFDNLKVFNKEGKDCTGEVKFMNGWRITIKGTLLLWNIMKAKNHPYLLTRKLNCECLDKFKNVLLVPIASASGLISTPSFYSLYLQFYVTCYFINEKLHDENEEFNISHYVRRVFRRIPPIRHNIGNTEMNASESNSDIEDLNTRFGGLMRELLDLGR
ncbi:uncharacterized protein [Leptinotarsa decemlineata]|uniref:uncharacterized protein n=1 Tax=Leptinotarsa decemlineata TaxID=7539 RepID=UPI000C254E61|nr:uncharacterized protein LOC111508317 [Leptinotarsa decemlineata]